MVGQRGSALILAMGVMMILTIFAAGVLPLVNNEVKFTKLNSDAIEARFAAEAGLRRVIIAFREPPMDWNWLDEGPQALTTSSSKNYTITILDSHGNNVHPAATPTPGTYTVTSVGNVNGVLRTAKVDITVTAGGGGPIVGALNGFGSSSPFTNMVFAGGAMAIGQNGSIEGVVASNGPISVRQHTAISGGYTQIAGITDLPDFSADGAFNFSNYTSGAPISNNTSSLNQSLYYTAGSVVFSQNVTLDSSSAPNGMTIIYAKGNVVINQNTNLADGSKIMIIAGGNISVEQNFNKAVDNVKNSSLILVANGTINISQNSHFNGTAVANGSVSIGQNPDMHYEPAAISAFSSGSGGGYSANPTPNTWN